MCKTFIYIINQALNEGLNQEDDDHLGFRVYLFGSTLTHDQPNDIDLLITYELVDQNSILKALKIKHRIVELVTKWCNLPVHTVLLSFAEESFEQFAIKEGASLIREYE